MSSSHPTNGPSLLDKSKATPASVDMAIFEKKQAPAGQGTVSSDYLARCREEDPWPAGTAPASCAPQEQAPPVTEEPQTKSVTKLVLTLFTDGTMNDAEADIMTGTQSNVAKLFTLLSEGELEGALHAKKYVVGIGGGHRVDDSSNWANRKLQGAGHGALQGVEGFSGLGFSDRIAEAMGWISELAGENPDAQISIQLFGFSRGAAEAIHLTNILNDDLERARHKLSGRNVSVRFVGLFDPVGSLGMPGNDVNPGAKLELRGDMAEVVVSLIAQSEVRSFFDLISIRIPPAESRGPYSWPSSEWLTKGKGCALPNPKWEEWVMPGAHSDVGGGYGAEEWIPDVCFQFDTNNPSALRNPGAAQEAWIPDRKPNESLEDYVFRMKDREMDFGAAPRGAASNGFWSRSEIETRIKMIYEQKMDRWRQKRDEKASGNHSMSMDKFFRDHPMLPKIRSRDNSLGRIALWVMIERARKAGVKWKAIERLEENIRSHLAPLPKSHPLYSFHEKTHDPLLIEQELRVDNPTFRNLIAP
ncbi:MAG: DUF2235 domain-containing protein, partial [Fibrobacterota bacterium]